MGDEGDADVEVDAGVDTDADVDWTNSYTPGGQGPRRMRRRDLNLVWGPCEAI